LNELSRLLELPETEKARRGLVHTPGEIAHQPDTWSKTFELFRSQRESIQNFLATAGVSGASGSRVIVYLVGAGTSDYTGRALSYLLRKNWQCEVIAVPSTDLLPQMEQLILPGRKYLWISFSRSGDSSEGVAVLEKARQRYPDIHHIVISSNPNGRMLTDCAGDPKTLGLCMIDEANDRGLAMTSSFSNMVVFGQCMAHIEDIDRYEPVLRKLVAAGKSLLPRAADCAAGVAKQEYTKACFVGTGPLREVAKESALKVLEMTAGMTLTMTESALGLRHGPMAALDDQSLFVCLLSGDKRAQGYERDLLREIGAKKNRTTPDRNRRKRDGHGFLCRRLSCAGRRAWHCGRISPAGGCDVWAIAWSIQFDSMETDAGLAQSWWSYHSSGRDSYYLFEVATGSEPETV
jgi:tagatose-6-phosphate ketose/aldose isomerase